MRMTFLLAVLAFVAAASGDVVSPRIGYHDAVGIPEAARIKAAEEAMMAEETDLPDAIPKIVGGAIAQVNAHPYLGGLLISVVGSSGRSVCGSSLITTNRLVTAAHCWFDGTRQAWQFEVVLGSQFLFSGGTRIATSSVVMHPQWNFQTLQNDVAMIYLPTSVWPSQTIQLIALPSGTQLGSDFAGWWTVAAGYGLTSDHGSVTTATQVSQVTLQVITNSQCQASFGTFAQPSNICTNGAGGVGICGGDSGGPLVVNQNGQNILVGISSFVARDGCQLGHPSAFARVTSFYSFIIQHL